MANKKFSQFTAQPPDAATSYLVGYDSAANDNIRFQEGDLNLADMGGAIDLATQTSGDISLTTQVTGTLPEANGGTGATIIQNNARVGRKVTVALYWSSNFANVPRGAEYGLPWNSSIQYDINGGDYGAAPSTSLPSPPVAALPGKIFYFFVAINSAVGYANNPALWEFKFRMAFFDMTADLDIIGGCYTSTSQNFSTGVQKHLLIKTSAVEASDSRILEGSMFFVVQPATNAYVVPFVRFDNGAADPYPYYDAAYTNARNEFTIQRIY